MFAAALVLFAAGASACENDLFKAMSLLACVTQNSGGSLIGGDECASLKVTLKCMGENGCLTQKYCDEEFKAPEGCDAKCEVPACFPATARVELENGKTKSMDQLVIGDNIRVSEKEFSEVYYFSTELTETTSKFVKITTAETGLMLTPGHFLYVNGNLVEARTVKVGDVVITGNGTKTTVTEVSSAWGPGLYNPHTLNGDIVVDGILTSTYTSAVHPKLAHALLTPLRVMYNAGVTFGESFNAHALAKGMPNWILEAIRY